MQNVLQSLSEWWSGFCDDFKLNFIEKDRWKYLTEGLGRTLEITLFAVMIGIVLGFIVAKSAQHIRRPAS